MAQRRPCFPCGLFSVPLQAVCQYVEQPWKALAVGLSFFLLFFFLAVLTNLLGFES